MCVISKNEKKKCRTCHIVVNIIVWKNHEKPMFVLTGGRLTAEVVDSES